MTKKTSYGIIETIGGFVLARSYRHIQQYEKEINDLKEKGLWLERKGVHHDLKTILRVMNKYSLLSVQGRCNYDTGNSGLKK